MVLCVQRRCAPPFALTPSTQTSTLSTIHFTTRRLDRQTLQDVAFSYRLFRGAMAKISKQRRMLLTQLHAELRTTTSASNSRCGSLVVEPACFSACVGMLWAAVRGRMQLRQLTHTRCAVCTSMRDVGNASRDATTRPYFFVVALLLPPLLGRYNNDTLYTTDELGPRCRSVLLLNAIDSNLRREYVLDGVFSWSLKKLLPPMVTSELAVGCQCVGLGVASWLRNSVAG